MKTISEYLEECRNMASHNLLCYSATYGMDTPKPGFESQYAEALRDCEIVDELIARERAGSLTAVDKESERQHIIKKAMADAFGDDETELADVDIVSIDMVRMVREADKRRESTPHNQNNKAETEG